MSSLSKQQFNALLKLQQQLLQRFWQKQGNMYRWSTGLSYGFSLLLAIVLAACTGFLVALPSFSGLEILMTKSAISERLLLWIWGFAFGVLGIMWTLSPLLFVMKNESLSLDLRLLIRYPIPSALLHRFHSLLAFFEPWSVFFYPALIAVIFASAYWPDTPLTVRLCLLPLLALWAVVHTLCNRLLQDIMLRLFQSRYWKEVLSLALLFVVILISFAPAFIAEQIATSPVPRLKQSNPEALLYSLSFWPALETGINTALYFSPPGLLVQGLIALTKKSYTLWLQSCFSLALWSLLVYFLSWQSFKGLLQSSNAQQGSKASANSSTGLRIPLPGIVRVVALKDLRTYFRSLLGKLAFFLTPLMVILLRGAGLGRDVGLSRYSYLLSIIGYVFLTSMYLYINFFGHEGEGFKHYILSGVSARQVLLGKNLALFLFGGAQFSLILCLFAGLYRELSVELLLFGWISFISLCIGMISTGNILSIRTPGIMDLNQSHYRQNNAAPIVLGFQVLMFLSAIHSLPLLLSWWFNESLVLLSSGLCLLMLMGWWLLLNYSASLFGQEAPRILGVLTQKDLIE